MSSFPLLPKSGAPEWDTDRPYLTGASLFEPPPYTPPPLRTYPLASQQALAIDDALYALLGMRTSYTSIGSQEESAIYEPQPSLLLHAAPEVSPLLARILPLASYHAAISAFVEKTRVAKRGCGFVPQAVSLALSELLTDYRALILNLEEALHKGNLHLQKLLYYIQPGLRTMALLHSVVVACNGKNGGAVLDALYKLAMTHVGADDVGHVLEFVVGKAAAPVFAIMDVWIRTGVIDDPYDEFFISENNAYAGGASGATIATSSSAWELRYAVNRENLPDFLAPFVENVLRSGKYLNVLRECGLDAAKVAAKSVKNQRDRAGLLTSADFPFAHFELSGEVLLGPEASRRIASVVENSFTVSSRALMEYLDEEIKIMQRLRSLRRYFLLEQSDFLATFFDAAATELGKRRQDVSRSRLASLLELSMRTSASSHDAFQDDVLSILCHADFASQILSVALGDGRSGDHSNSGRSGVNTISGYESFALDYRLRWPVSLIVSSMEILKYQFIFRYLFYCKYVERELEECWKYHIRAKGPLWKAPSSIVRSFALRNRMLQFIRNILYYTTADVLEPNWRVMEVNIRRASTVDELMMHHAKFLDISVEQSLLSNETHLRVFKSVAETCISFATYSEKYSYMFRSMMDLESVEEELRTHNYSRTLSKFETAFDMHLGKLLDGLSAFSKKRANDHLSNLCERLDVDGFYNRTVERSLASYGL
eukprot:GFKZ01000173.1.p1 GENE.GFKZ01000173.1~~GFKZ01000173.1.p1  ORF type:complete len:713 (-),score=85.62 GFKZ01000173.1:1678-3816(-)